LNVTVTTDFNQVPFLEDAGISASEAILPRLGICEGFR
jgi:hypothetical protein